MGSQVQEVGPILLTFQSVLERKMKVQSVPVHCKFHLLPHESVPTHWLTPSQVITMVPEGKQLQLLPDTPEKVACNVVGNVFEQQSVVTFDAADALDEIDAAADEPAETDDADADEEADTDDEADADADGEADAEAAAETADTPALEAAADTAELARADEATDVADTADEIADAVTLEAAPDTADEAPDAAALDAA